MKASIQSATKPMQELQKFKSKLYQLKLWVKRDFELFWIQQSVIVWSIKSFVASREIELQIKKN